MKKLNLMPPRLVQIQNKRKHLRSLVTSLTVLGITFGVIFITLTVTEFILERQNFLLSETLFKYESEYPDLSASLLEREQGRMYYRNPKLLWTQAELPDTVTINSVDYRNSEYFFQIQSISLTDALTARELLNDYFTEVITNAVYYNNSVYIFEIQALSYIR